MSLSRQQKRNAKKRKLNKLKIKPFSMPPSKRQKLDGSKDKIVQNDGDNKSKHEYEYKVKLDVDKTKSNNNASQTESFWDNLDINGDMVFSNCMHNLLPNDVEIAMNKLLNEFPKTMLDPFPMLAAKDKDDKKIYAIPVILLSQIYSLIKDHTFVDQCIDKMKRENKIRHFRVQIDKTKRKKIIKDLNTSNIERNRNELAHKQYYDNGIIDLYTFTNQYNNYIIQNLQSQFVSDNDRDNKDNAFYYKILDKFMNNLLPNFYNHLISKQEIVKYLIDETVVYDDKSKKELIDKTISLLMSCGLILQKMDNIYSFSYPKSFKITRSIGCGRKEIISFIWKKKYHETLKKDILLHKMKESCMDSLFHYRDLLGSQIIKETECAAGILVQMT